MTTKEQENLDAFCEKHNVDANFDKGSAEQCHACCLKTGKNGDEQMRKTCDGVPCTGKQACYFTPRIVYTISFTEPTSS